MCNASASRSLHRMMSRASLQWAGRKANLLRSLIHVSEAGHEPIKQKNRKLLHSAGAVAIQHDKNQFKALDCNKGADLDGLKQCRGVGMNLHHPADR